MNSKVLSHSDSNMTLLYTSSSKDSDPTEKYYYLASLFDGLHFGSGRSNIHFNLCSEVRRTIPQAGGGGMKCYLYYCLEILGIKVELI